MNNVFYQRPSTTLSQKKSTNFYDQENDTGLSIPITILFGNNELHIPAQSIMRQDFQGNIFFNNEAHIEYKLINYEWSGPIYENVTTSNMNSNTRSNTVKKGKSGRMLTGALVGTVLFPGVGTAVGAAIGAGGKTKSYTTTNSGSNSQAVSKNVERYSTAILTLQKVDDNTIYKINIQCSSGIDAKLRCFNIIENKGTADLSQQAIDSLKGIKALKELLDMGAITEEEFEYKKKQLLN